MKSPISDWIFRLAVESTSTGVLVTGPQENDCPILYANPYFRQMTGFSEEEILGKNCRFLHGPGTDPTVVNMIRETLSSENVFRGEILNYRKDGRPFWNQLTIAPVKNLEGGSAPYFVGIQQDISLGKEAILERDELISELKALNMGLSRFASTASHEMKNPLSAIIGFSRLLRDNYFSSLGTEGQLLLERISVNANYLNQCLDQLRIFGTLGHAPISLESTHLSNLIDEVLQIIGLGSEHAKNVRYSFGLPVIKCSRQHMIQVFRNLIENAFKYGMARERGVFISAKLREDQGCEIRVSDRGQGIPDYIRDSVFEPFVTTSESLDGGTGLGLAIVKKIIEVHEGSIDFETSSQGTTFLIKLKN